MSTQPQPTEAHRKLWTALYNLAHREIFDDYAESSDGPATQLLADSEARAVEAATAQLRSELDYAKASETLYHDEGTAAINAALTDEREKVRVLREALAALLGDEWRMSCDWGPSAERKQITEAARAALAATEEKP